MNLLIKGIYTLIIAFMLGIFICPMLIPFLHRLKFGDVYKRQRLRRFWPTPAT